MARVDFRKRLTDRLIAFIAENDGMPWQKGWNAVNVRPFNPGSGVKYRGGNVLNLINAALERNSDDSRWMTLKQANAKGYSVRKGAKGELVEYWDWGQPQASPVRQLDADGKPVSVALKDAAGSVGEGEAVAGRSRKPIVFYAVVFNGADIQGLPEMKREVSWQPNELAEKLISATGARIEHKALSKTAGGRAMANAAYFDNGADQIVLPPRSSFKSDGNYYATVLHELAHWTGHGSRLGRLSNDIKFGTPEYAKEELRAEIAAMFLTSMLGLDGDVQNHARYAASWIDVLKKDKHELFRAAKDAESIVDHIFEYAPELKAHIDERFERNLLKTNPARIRENSLGDLPSFGPVSQPSVGEAGVGREDSRWPGFEKAVRGEAKKYGILEATVERTLELMEPIFTDVMVSAKKNGYTVEDMHGMLLDQLVNEMRQNNEREMQWAKFCDQVRHAASGLMPLEAVEQRLQQMSVEYQRILQIAVQDEWKQEDTDLAVREMIFGQGGRRPITPEYIQEQFMLSGNSLADLDDDAPLSLTGSGMALGDASTQPHTTRGNDDDDMVLTLPGESLALEDAMPVDAAAMPDERVGNARSRATEPESEYSPSP